MQLDRELQQEENDMISDIVSRNEDQRKDTVNMMTDGLAGKLQGDLKDSQVKDILDKYEKDLDANMSKFNLEKEKQLQDLRRKLAEKRRRKEALLREKHNKEVRRGQTSLWMEGWKKLIFPNSNLTNQFFYNS